MPSSQKRKRSYSATTQLNHDFQVLNNHDPWRASSQQISSHHNHQITPRNHQDKSGNFQHKVFPSPQILSSRRDPSRSYDNSKFRNNNIPSQYIDSQSYEIPSSQKSSKHGNKDKKKHRAQSVPASSPFVPDATSTPDHRQSTKPVPVSIPIDPRLNENYIKAQAEAIRQRARENKAEQTFSSHVSSSSSASETSDSDSSTDTSSNRNKDSTSEESDSTPSPRPKESKSKKTKPKSKRADRNAISSDKLRKKEKKKSKEDLGESIETPVKDATKKKKSKADYKEQRIASPPAAKPLPTTKQTNQTLESNLFTTLTTIIPTYLISQARTTLTTEVQSKAKTSHEATPYVGNSSGPSDRAVTLRAAHDLLVRLSVQRFVQNSASGGVNLGGHVDMESDLGRIAAERGKRIELLEMENRGLKSQIERAMAQVDGADDHVDKMENGDEDEDEGRREKKKRRKN